MSNLGQVTATNFPSTTSFHSQTVHTAAVGYDYDLTRVVLDMNGTGPSPRIEFRRAGSDNRPVDGSAGFLANLTDADESAAAGQQTFTPDRPVVLRAGRKYSVKINWVSSSRRPGATHGDGETGLSGWLVHNLRHIKNNGTSNPVIKLALYGRRVPALTGELFRLVSIDQPGGREHQRFDLVLGEAIQMRTRDMRAHTFAVENGEVVLVRRVRRESRRGPDGRSSIWSSDWRVWVEPAEFDQDVVVSLIRKDSCDHEGAICTEDGRQLELDLEGILARRACYRCPSKKPRARRSAMGG